MKIKGHFLPSTTINKQANTSTPGIWPIKWRQTIIVQRFQVKKLQLVQSPPELLIRFP